MKPFDEAAAGERRMKRILTAILAALLVPCAFWLGGWNFDTRGEAATLCFFLTLAAAGYLWFAPWWEMKEEQ